VRWSGLVAVVIAVGVAASVIIIAVAIFEAPGHLNPDEATLLSTILGAAVGAIATYLGTHGGRGDGPPSRPEEPPHMYGIVATREPTTGTPAPDEAERDGGPVGENPP
jgi:hypothetical protein